MGSKTKLILVGGVFLILALAFLFYTGAFTGQVVVSYPDDTFIKCLNEKGVVMYGFMNNPSVRAQLSLFGSAVANLTVVDCHYMPEECVGVIIYPSWKVDNRIISSGLSVGMLSDLSGCKL